MTLSNGGLTVTTTSSGAWGTTRNSISHTTGKWYVEFSNSVVISGTPTQNYAGFGFASSSANPATYLGNAATPYSTGIWVSNLNNVSAGFTSNYVSTLPLQVQNDVLALAIDFGAGSIWIAKNNVWSDSSNPATGALPIVSFAPATVGALFAAFSGFGAPGFGVWTLQSTAASQKYAPPSGFSAWDGGVAPPPTSVWSAADATAGGMTLSNGGLTVTPSGAGSWGSIRGSISQTSGKLYVEFKTSAAVTNWPWGPGFASSGFNPADNLGGNNYSCGILPQTGNNVSSGFTGNYISTLAYLPAAGDVYGVAIDFTAGSIWLSYNNTWSNASNPATGSSPILSFVPATVGALFAAMMFNGSGVGVWTLQSTAASQKYAPPSGFSAWDGGVAPPPTSVWSSSDASANGMTLSNGGKTVVAAAVGYQSVSRVDQSNVWQILRGIFNDHGIVARRAWGEQ